MRVATLDNEKQEVALVDRQIGNVRLEVAVYVGGALLFVVVTVMLAIFRTSGDPLSSLVGAAKPLLTTMLSGVTVGRVFQKLSQISSLRYLRDQLVAFDTLEPQRQTTLLTTVRAFADRGLLGGGER